MEDVSENESSATKPRKRLPKWLRIALWTGLTVMILCCGLPALLYQPVAYQMERTKVGQIAYFLATAIANYHSEYRQYPAVRGTLVDGDLRTDTSSNSRLAGILMGENPRGILFFSVRRAHWDEGDFGLWFEGDDIAGASIYDHWENHFQVVIDANGDGKIEVPKPGGAPHETIILEQGVAVWSYGPNGVPGKGDDSWDDDIYSYSLAEGSDE